MLASLAETFPGIDWERQGAYFFQRVIQHGRRRAEEMREAAQTVRESGSSRGPPPAPRSARPWSPTWPTPARWATARPPARTGASMPIASSPRSPAQAEPTPRHATTMDPDYLPFHPDPSRPRFARAAGRGGRALPRVRPGRACSPTRRSASTRRATRRRRSCSRCATSSASSATSSSRRPATATTTARWSTRSSTPDGRARGVASVGRDVTDAELEAMHAAGVRGTRFNFVRRLVDFTPREVLFEIAQPHRAARLARRRLLRGAGPARAVGFLHHAAHHGRRRSHGPARRRASRSTGRSSSGSSGSCASIRTSGRR